MAVAGLVPDNGIRAQALRQEFDEWRSEMRSLNARMSSRMELILPMLKRMKDPISPSEPFIGAPPPAIITASSPSAPVVSPPSITTPSSSPAIFLARLPSFATPLKPQLQPPTGSVPASSTSDFASRSNGRPTAICTGDDPHLPFQHGIDDDRRDLDLNLDEDPRYLDPDPDLNPIAQPRHDSGRRINQRVSTGIPIARSDPIHNHLRVGARISLKSLRIPYNFFACLFIDERGFSDATKHSLSSPSTYPNHFSVEIPTNLIDLELDGGPHHLRPPEPPPVVSSPSFPLVPSPPVYLPPPMTSTLSPSSQWWPEHPHSNACHLFDETPHRNFYFLCYISKILKACSKLHALSKGATVHVDMKKRHHQLRTILCGRCKLLSHGQMVTAVGGHGGYSGGRQFISAEELREKLSHLRYEKVLIVMLVDIVDFNGSGKGTHCAKIAEAFGFTHLSAGDFLRSEMSSDSENGAMIRDTIKEGRIVPSEVTVSLICKAIEPSENDKLLIDGFPRSNENRITIEEIDMVDEDFTSRPAVADQIHSVDMIFVKNLGDRGKQEFSLWFQYIQIFGGHSMGVIGLHHWLCMLMSSLATEWALPLIPALKKSVENSPLLEKTKKSSPNNNPLLLTSLYVRDFGANMSDSLLYEVFNQVGEEAAQNAIVKLSGLALNDKVAYEWPFLLKPGREKSC